MLLSALGIGAIGAIVGSGSMGTFAGYTATTVNRGQSFTAGTLRQTNTGTTPCSQVVASTCGTLTLTSASGMSPGDIATGTVRITNSGTLPATMTVASNVTSSSGLESSLNMTVHDDTKGVCLYGGSGSLCDDLSGVATVIRAFQTFSAVAMAGTTRSDSRWDAGESHQVTVKVEVISSASAAAANKTATIDFIWSGVQ